MKTINRKCEYTYEYGEYLQNDARFYICNSFVRDYLGVDLNYNDKVSVTLSDEPQEGFKEVRIMYIDHNFYWISNDNTGACGGTFSLMRQDLETLFNPKPDVGEFQHFKVYVKVEKI